MRVVMFCSNYPPHTGGLEVMVQSLASALSRRHAVTIISCAWDGNSGVSHEHGIEVHRLPALHRTERWGVPYPVPFGPGIGRALDAGREADVIHAHGALYATTIMAAFAARRYRTPLVLTEHVGFVSYESEILNRVQHAAWYAVGDPIVRQVIATAVYNRRVQSWMQGRFPGGAVWYIGNGVDGLTFSPREAGELAALRRSFGLPDGPLVLFVGRDAAKKNLDILLRLPRDSYTLVTCGAERRLSGKGVIDLGIVPHTRMADIYACVDLMVLPSTGEGFPLAAQEAVSSGLPLVLLWDHGYEGWLDPGVVAACNSVAELGPAIEQLIGNHEARARLSADERDWAQRKWSWDRTAEAYEDLYAQAMTWRLSRKHVIGSDLALD